MLPTRAGNVFPPLQKLIQGNRGIGRLKNCRTGYQKLLRYTGKLFGCRLSLGNGDITCRFDKCTKLSIRNFRFIHPKSIDIDPVNRNRIHRRPRRTTKRLVLRLTTHRKFSTRDPLHTGRSGIWLGNLVLDGWEKRNCLNRLQLVSLQLYFCRIRLLLLIDLFGILRWPPSHVGNQSERKNHSRCDTPKESRRRAIRTG